MTNTTHTDEIEIVQLYYLVPGCVVSMFKNYIYQSEYVSMVRQVSTQEVALYFGFKARRCDHTNVSARKFYLGVKVAPEDLF